MRLGSLVIELPQLSDREKRFVARELDRISATTNLDGSTVNNDIVEYLEGAAHKDTIHDIVGSLITTSGTGVSVTYDDSAGTLTIALDGDLDDLGALSHTDGYMIESDGTDWQAVAPGATHAFAQTAAMRWMGL